MEKVAKAIILGEIKREAKLKMEVGWSLKLHLMPKIIFIF